MAMHSHSAGHSMVLSIALLLLFGVQAFISRGAHNIPRKPLMPLPGRSLPFSKRALMKLRSAPDGDDSAPPMIPKPTLEDAKSLPQYDEVELGLMNDPAVLASVNDIPYHVLYIQLRERGLPISGNNVEMVARIIHHDNGTAYNIRNIPRVASNEIPPEIQQLMKAHATQGISPNSTFVPAPRPRIQQPHDGLIRSETRLSLGGGMTPVDSYVVKSPQTSAQKGGRFLIVLFTEESGYLRKSARLLADSIALQVESIVIVPDMFHGDAYPIENADPEAFDEWKAKHNSRRIEREMYRFIQSAKDRWNTSTSAVVGVGFGASVALNLAASHPPMNISNIPGLTKPEGENEDIEKDEASLYMRRAQLTELVQEVSLNASMHRSPAHKPSQNRTRSMDDITDEELERVYKRIDEAMASDEIKAKDIIRQTLLSEANADNENRIEQLVDDLLTSGHQDALSATAQILSNKTNVLENLQQLKTKLMDQTDTTLPQRLQARREWFTAGPDVVIAVSPTLKSVEKLVKQLSQPVMLIQTGNGTEHEQAQELFQSLKNRNNKHDMLFMTYKDCSPTFLHRWKDTKEECCAQDALVNICAWLELYLRPNLIYKDHEDEDPQYNVIGFEDVSSQVQQSALMDHIHNHLLP